MPLTDEQYAFLEGKRKATPPTYYSADSDTNISVGGYIEDAMILATPESKSKAITYLKLILDANGGSSDYTDLLTEYVDQQVTNSKALKDAFDNLTAKFGEFKDGLTKGADETLLREGMNPLLKAINKGLGKAVSQQRSADFKYDYDSSAKEFFDTKVTNRQKKELRSWIRVLAVYR